MKTKTLITSFLLIFIAGFGEISKASGDFGDADFREDIEADGPKSYHDTWCKKIKNKCRVRFQGRSMWVEGQGGIDRSQLLTIRRDTDGNN